MNLGLEDEFRKSLPENFHYLRDSSVIIDGIHFYGTPWTPEFCNWYFMKYDTEEGLGKIFSKIPEGVDYMLSHGPMWGCNDMIEKPIYQSQSDKGHLGSKMLAKYAKLAKVKNIFVGHIHSGSHKEEKILWDINDLNGYITSVNVSILDEEYKPFYKDVYTKKD
jgi:Icc-related predicted phosphoesterase